MKRSGKLVVVAAAAVTVLGVGAGVAGAQSTSSHRTTSNPAVEEPTTPDTDNVQQGDQTTPDVAPAHAVLQTTAHRTAVHLASVHQASVQSSVQRATGQRSVADEPGENNGENNETGPGDGADGGHEDPPGDVQHEGGANEP
jgi:hypothetical protein